MTKNAGKKMIKVRNVLYWFIDFIIIVVLVAADQFTKKLAVEHLMNKAPISVIKDFLILEYLENRGAAFGMLQNQSLFFIAIGVLFVCIIVVALVRIPTYGKYHFLRFLLSLITAGAIGNMIDRVTLKYVIDFIYVIYIDFPVFNVADIYVTLGTAALLITILFVWKEDDLDMKKANNPKIHSAFLNPENKSEK